MSYPAEGAVNAIDTHLVGSQLGVCGTCSGVAPGCIGVWLPHACIGVAAPGCIGVLPPAVRPALAWCCALRHYVRH